MNKPALAAIVGGTATAVSGVLVQAVVQPKSTVSDTMWSYPWTPDALVGVSIGYAVIHLIVLAGVYGFARSGATGTGRLGRIGTALALTGTALLFAAELATIPFRHQKLADTGPTIAGGVFALAILLSAVGFLLAGIATVRTGCWSNWRRFVPLAEGLWMIALIGVSLTKALPAGVAIYGAFIVLLGIALYPRPATTSAGRPQPATRATVVS